MGKKVWVCICLALLLTGCAGGERAADGNADRVAPPPAETAAAEQGGDMHAEQVAADARTLTEEEILAAYDGLLTFTAGSSCLRCPDNGETVTAEDGAVCRPGGLSRGGDDGRSAHLPAERVF